MTDLTEVAKEYRDYLRRWKAFHVNQAKHHFDALQAAQKRRKELLEKFS